MVTLIKQFITKIGLHDEPLVVEKTTELLRLLELRSVNMQLQINEYGKIVLCADIAATLLSIPIDKEQALKVSGLRKSHYANHKRLIEKLLELNRIVSVNEICIQLGMHEISPKAEELLKLYKRTMSNADGADDDDDVTSHPQYATMAVYCAAKLMKKKLAKTKCMPYSNLRPLQWHDLEQRWNRFMAKYYTSAKDDAQFLTQPSEKEDKNKMCGSISTAKVSAAKTNDNYEDYETWKTRMLKIAELQFKQQQTDNAQLEKENSVLSY